jgi:hypothetical protein
MTVDRQSRKRFLGLPSDIKISRSNKLASSSNFQQMLRSGATTSLLIVKWIGVNSNGGDTDRCRKHLRPTVPTNFPSYQAIRQLRREESRLGLRSEAVSGRLRSLAPGQQMLTVVLPSLRADSRNGRSDAFHLEWNEFVLPLIIIRDADSLPVMVQLQRLAGEYVKFFGPLMAGYAIASIPLIILFTFSLRLFVKRNDRGSHQRLTTVGRALSDTFGFPHSWKRATALV